MLEWIYISTCVYIMRQKSIPCIEMLSGNRELSMRILCLLCHILLVLIRTEYSWQLHYFEHRITSLYTYSNFEACSLYKS